MYFQVLLSIMVLYRDPFALYESAHASNTVVMVSIVDSQRTILLDPIGTNVWRLAMSHRAQHGLISVTAVNIRRA